MNSCAYNTYHHFFSNLANPLKVDIIISLKEKEKSVNEIAENLDEEQSKISHALVSLKLCNIVESKQKGKQKIYSLNKKTIVPMLNLIDKHAQTQCSNCAFGCS